MDTALELPLPLHQRAPRTDTGSFTYPPGRTQFLPVSGTLTDRLLITYRAPASTLASLVPAPFELDTFDGFGFLSVCAVEIARMGIEGLPGFLRFDNREFLYRIGVRLRGEPTFLTLRSDVSSRALAFLGRHFSHYRPQLGRIWIFRDGELLRMEGTTPSGDGDGVVEADLASRPREASVFSNDEQAADFLLGMKFSSDVVRGRVRLQPIDHAPWRPRLVDTRAARFEFVDTLERQLHTRFELDSTLAVQDVPHVWRAARWL